MPPSIQESVGSTALLKVAIALVRGFNMTLDEAFPLIEEWNQANSQPPWNERDLRHKLEDATKAKAEAGYLLKDRDGDRTHKGAKPFTPTPATFTPGEPDPTALETFQKRRGLSREAIRCAIDVGALQVGRHNHYGRCVAMCEGDWWQCRPIAESTFRNGRKTMSKPGPAPEFFGGTWLGDYPNVILVEGCIGLVEAFDAIGRFGDIRWGAIAAYAAHSSFAKDLATLGKMIHRNVIIIPDAGKKGREACQRWIGELMTVGCSVEIANLPDGCNDLGDVLRREDCAEFLNELFN